MEFMREHYNHLTSDHFGKTIIGDDDDDAVPATATAPATEE